MGFIFQKSTDKHFSSACSGISDIFRQSSLTDSIDAGAALRLYTDGGATHQSPRVAAWGLCVILEYPSGRFELVGTANDRVHTDAGHGEFLGASLGANNVAKLSAIAWAAAWLLNTPGVRHAEILYDSQYAADAVSGTSCVRANHEIIELASAMIWKLRNTCQVSFSHVKDHAGEPFNDLADSLATAAMK